MRRRSFVREYFLFQLRHYKVDPHHVHAPGCGHIHVEGEGPPHVHENGGHHEEDGHIHERSRVHQGHDAFLPRTQNQSGGGAIFTEPPQKTQTETQANRSDPGTSHPSESHARRSPDSPFPLSSRGEASSAFVRNFQASLSSFVQQGSAVRPQAQTPRSFQEAGLRGGMNPSVPAGRSQNFIGGASSSESNRLTHALLRTLPASGGLAEPGPALFQLQKSFSSLLLTQSTFPAFRVVLNSWMAQLGFSGLPQLSAPMKLILGMNLLLRAEGTFQAAPAWSQRAAFASAPGSLSFFFPLWGPRVFQMEAGGRHGTPGLFLKMEKDLSSLSQILGRQNLMGPQSTDQTKSKIVDQSRMATLYALKDPQKKIWRENAGYDKKSSLEQVNGKSDVSYEENDGESRFSSRTDFEEIDQLIR